MANYNLVIDSTFQPFSFERYIQPLTIYGEAYNSLEGALTELSTKAGEFEALAESEKLRNGENSATYKRYSTYSQDLKKQADELATRGLGIGNRKALMDLKTRYSTEIKPIQEAKDTLKTLMDERRKLEIANPTLKYERDFTEVGVDELLLNPDLTYGKTYTGALIEEQVGKAAQALGKQIRTDPVYTKILRNQYYQSKIQQGYTTEEVLLASLGDPKAPKELSDLVKSALVNSGVYGWEGMYNANGDLTTKGEAVMNDVKSYINRGLNYAVGTTSYGTVSNKAYDYAMQAALARERARDKEETPPKINLLHWSEQIGSESAEKAKRARELLSKIITQGIDGSYTQRAGKDGKYYNPMAIYEEMIKYAKENKTYYTTLGNRFSGPQHVDNSEANAKRVMEEKYGLPIITKEEYDLLKELGYTTSSMEGAFNSLPSSIDSYITTYRPTDLNMANYDNLGDVLYGRINEETLKEGNIINVYTGGSDLGKQVKYEDLFDSDGKPNHKITSVAYSLQTPNRIIIETGGNRYSINAGLLSEEAANIINTYTSSLSSLSLRDQARAQDLIAYYLRELFNSYDPLAPETSSKR